MEWQIIESIIKNLQDKKKQKPWYVWFISLAIIIISVIVEITTPYCNMIKDSSIKETEAQKTLKILFYMTAAALIIILYIIKH